MHNSYIRPGGIWSGGVPVLHGELTQMDQTLFGCISGDNGGSWAPSSIITIGGAGLNVTGDFFSSGFCNILHSATIGSGPTDTLGVFSTTTFNAPVVFDSGITINSGFVSNANSSFAGSGTHLTFGTGTVLSLATGSSFVCSAGALFNASVTCGTTLAVTGAATMASTLAVGGDITLAGAGAIVERVVTGTASNSTYSVSTADTVFVPNTLTGTYTYTLDHIDAVAGKKMRVVLEAFSSGMEIDLLDITAGRIPLAFRVKNSAGNYTSVEVQFISGAWKMIGFCPAF